MVRCILSASLFFLLAAPAVAAPVSYVLEPELSSVGFETSFGADRITGKMPVLRADVTLDLDAVEHSTVAVTLNARDADASFPFAAQAMRGPSVLDTNSFPTIVFISTKVIRDGDGAQIRGNLTIRGVTRPVTLAARISRQKGRAASDLTHLTFRLLGSVKRSQFGATGWANMVGDEVHLDILARVAQVK